MEAQKHLEELLLSGADLQLRRIRGVTQDATLGEWVYDTYYDGNNNDKSVKFAERQLMKDWERWGREKGLKK